MKKLIFDDILGIILLFSVVSIPSANEAMNVWDLKYFHISIIVLFIASTFNKAVRPVGNLYLLSFLNIITLSSAFFINFEGLSLLNCLNYLLASIGMVLIIQNCDNPKNVYKWIIAGAMINLFVLLFQHLGWNPIMKNAPPDFHGAMLSNSPRYAAFIGMILPIIYQWSIPVFILSAITCLYPDINSTTLLIVALIAWFKINNKYLKTVMVLMFLGGLTYFHNHILGALKIRFTQIYNVTFETYLQKPLLGYGVGASMGNTHIGADNQMQSSFLQFIFGTGIVGIIYIINIIKTCLDNFKRTTNSLCIFSLLILCCFEYPLEIKRLWLTIISLIAFFIIEIYEHERNENGLSKI